MKSFIKKLLREGLLDEATTDEIKAKYYPNIPQNIFDRLVATDTITSNLNKGKVGKYAKWLLKLFNSDYLEFRDLENAEKYIKIYDKLLKSKKPVINSDINTYKSLDTLVYDIDDYLDDAENISKTDKAKRIKNQSRVIYSDNRFKVIELLSKEAACYYGKGTKLCTSSDTSDNYFDKYANSGSLYLIIDTSKRNSVGDYVKYQVHLERDEYKDHNNQNINFYKTPEIKEVIQKIIELRYDPYELIKSKPSLIKFFDDPTEEVQLMAIEKDPYLVKYINYPTEKVKLKVISMNPSLNKYINMTDEERVKSDIEDKKAQLNMGFISQGEYDDFIDSLPPLK